MKNIKDRLKSIGNRINSKLSPYYKSLLATLYVTPLIDDAILTANNISKVGVGEDSDYARNMMISFGEYPGMAVAASVEAGVVTLIVKSTLAATPLIVNEISKKYPKLKEYSVINKIPAYAMLAYFGINHIRGALSWF